VTGRSARGDTTVSRRTEPRIAAELTTLPINLVHAQVATKPCRLLVDSGAASIVLSGDIHRCLRESLFTVRPKRRHATLSSADSTPMKVLCDIDVNIRIGGLNLPCAFAFIQNLGFQAVLGMQFLHDVKAVIQVANHTLQLYDGLTAVPIVRADDNAFIVRTVNRVAIPPRSEAVLNASLDTRRDNGMYMIQPTMWAKCQQLLPAHTIFDATKRVFCCRVLNATEKRFVSHHVLL
jgi:hypothetical protein